MMTSNDLRSGMYIIVDGHIHEVIEASHYKPGKGHAFVTTKLQNLSSGAIYEKRFRAKEPIENAFVEKKPFEYLYRDGSRYVFMDPQSFEQIEVGKEVIGDVVDYLKENVEVTCMIYKGEVLRIMLPSAVDLRVVATDPGVRGDTASGGSKPATLETGKVTQVPLHIKVGDVIRVDTRTGRYVERVSTGG